MLRTFVKFTFHISSLWVYKHGVDIAVVARHALYAGFTAFLIADCKLFDPLAVCLSEISFIKRRTSGTITFDPTPFLEADEVVASLIVKDLTLLIPYLT